MRNINLVLTKTQMHKQSAISVSRKMGSVSNIFYFVFDCLSNELVELDQVQQNDSCINVLICSCDKLTKQQRDKLVRDLDGVVIAEELDTNNK